MNYTHTAQLIQPFSDDTIVLAFIESQGTAIVSRNGSITSFLYGPDMLVALLSDRKFSNYEEVAAAYPEYFI